MFNSTCRTIFFIYLLYFSVCKLLQIVNFDSLTFLTPLILFDQSDYLDHSNKDSDWLIVACNVMECPGGTVTRF